MTNLARAARAQKWPPRPRAEKFLAPRRHLRPDLGQGPHFLRSAPQALKSSALFGPPNAPTHPMRRRLPRNLSPHASYAPQASAGTARIAYCGPY